MSAARVLGAALLSVAFPVAVRAQGGEPPGFSKAFGPPTIGPGSASLLTFTIQSADASPVTDLAFTDVLPAAVQIATPAGGATTCPDGMVTAPDGGTTVTLSEGTLGAFQTCVVTVYVTSATVGSHLNTSGDLTSSAGNSGPAEATLTVSAAAPGFGKSFSPAAVVVHQTSRLTFAVDNGANTAAVFNLAFSDSLPDGLVVASPPNTANTCGGLVTAAPGSALVSLGAGTVAAGSTCAVAVDVTPTTGGTKDNVSALTSTAGASGLAVASLASSFQFLGKSFPDGPAAPGTTTTLRFTITNFDRSAAASGIAFTDDLDAVLSGLVAGGLPPSPCGAGSQLTGAGVLSLTGGTLAPEASCTFEVSLQVPAGAADGSYLNTTSSVSADLGGVPTVFAAASNTLVVQSHPLLTKELIPAVVAAGDVTTVRFTLTNTSPTLAATGITFTDDLTAWVPGATASALPASDFCGAGSTLTVVGLPLAHVGLRMQNGSLAAGGSCTFDVEVTIPSDTTNGSYPNLTTAPAGTVNGVTLTGKPATATLSVVAGPGLDKAFTDDPAAPGGTVTLQFTLALSPNAPAGATGIGFTDDLDAALAGLAAIDTPKSDVCGAGSQVGGAGLLTFTGGSLAPGESCTFEVTLAVPAGALPGGHPNTTSTVAATVMGLAVTTSPAGDTLEVAGLALGKSFTDDPAVPGGTVTLEFTLTNASATLAADSISFTDDLAGALSGLAAVGLPLSDVCGLGSQIAGTTLLTFTGGALAPGSACTFPVTLAVPSGAAPGEYGNTTSPVTAQVDGNAVTVPGASDLLLVTAALGFAKEFTDDPTFPGGTVTLEFGIANVDPTRTATGIAFTDDLGAALPGLAAIGLPMNDVCGAGSQLAGTSLLTLTGGTLPAGGSCTFSVTLAVPASVSVASAVNTTSPLTATVGGVGFTGPPASDELTVHLVTLSKSFSGTALPGSPVTLSFTIVNDDATTPVTGLGFSDDLDAVLPGLAAVGLPSSDPCGAGSQVSGTSVITLTGGSLAGGGSCSFDVTVQVPAGAPAGSFLNTTSAVQSNGLPVAGPATASLSVGAGRPPAESIGPAATLLLPYFEVDLAGAGNTTLLSVNNASATAVLARVTLWTDLGVPTLGFHVYLTGYDVQTLNLRDVLTGTLPATASAGQDAGDSISPQGPLSQDINFASCAGLLPPPPLGAAEIDHLRAAHTGQPSGLLGGNCAGQDLGDGIARGYVTVDTVNACTMRGPGDPGYFVSGGAGDATNQNVLWGDYFLVDPVNNFAQGDSLVHIPADAADGETSLPGQYTFYGRLVGWSAADNRRPLGSRLANRFLAGGAFTGGTELTVWRDPKAVTAAFACPALAGARPAWYELGQEELAVFDEQEQVTSAGGTPFPAAANRILVGGSGLPVPFPFGWLFLNLSQENAAAGSNPPEDPRAAQGWVGGTMSAEGLFSVGFRALRLEGAGRATHTCLDGSSPPCP